MTRPLHPAAPPWAPLLATLAAIAALSTLPATAAPLPLGDPSFEGNSLTAGQWTNNLEPEWKETGGPDNGNGFEEYIPGFVFDGTDHLGMVSGHDVWQDLTQTYQTNTRYTFNVAVGNRNGSTEGGNQSQYLLADTTGTIYATGSFDASTLPTQSFAEAPALVFDTPNNPACIGRTIRVLLRARGNGRSHFDHLRLDATTLVPPGGATVVNLPATSIATNSATLNGQVTDIGNGAPTITLFWGPADGGTNPAAWAYSTALPGTHSGTFSLPVTSLSHAANHFFTARATNSAGTSWAPSSATFTTLPLPPAVETTAATAIGTVTATLGASVTQTGGQAPLVTIYYGQSDGGTNPAVWAASVSLGPLDGDAATTVTGLTGSTTYHFRAAAENNGGTAWAPAGLTFTTLTVTPPQVENRPASGLTGTTATLHGEVTDTGNEAPAVTVFYGPADGGTNPAAWAASATVGTSDGAFSRFIRNLTPQTNYYFRSKAANSAGTAWAPDSAAFTTTPLVPAGPVIHEFHYNPQDNTSLEEFIELHNPGDANLNLAGWTLAGAVSFTFPAGATLAPGGFLVVAENPAVILTKFGAQALGPWSGKLASRGETIELLNPAGTLVDRVEYQAGFPWPTGPDGAGPSCELIHPALDNDLGGSWRASGTAGIPATTYLPAAASAWKYKRGTSEASAPVDAWRAVAFDDSSWTTANAAFGYGAGYSVATTLSNMRNVHRTVYYRKAFTIPVGQIPDTLVLRLRYDDGLIVWINGAEVARRNVPAGQIPYNYGTDLSDHPASAWEEIPLTVAAVPGLVLYGGTNVVAVQSLNQFSGSQDYFFDLELRTNGSGGGTTSLPTPGAPNSAARATHQIPPQIRQVAHSPKSPAPGQPVTITARITDPDGPGPVTLAWQTVDPGNYIRLTDTAYSTAWSTTPMRDDGTNGDAVAGDFTYTAVLTAAVQVNRRLVRYKITLADALGNSLSVPYPDDEQPNFAYYVHAGLPAWQGALRPGSTPLDTYPSAVLDDVPVYTLVANGTDVINSQYNSGYDAQRFRGTFVHDGTVYDHIQFKNRGEASTYVSGKNKWRFFFNRARDFAARDTLGKPYSESWDSFSADACASPWAALHRGSAGVEEGLAYKVYQLAGLPSAATHYYHFRVVRGATETPPAGTTASDPLGTADGQYLGDFWGLYQAIEGVDGSFLDERGLPDGNLYKIENNAGDKKHQAPGQPLDSADWNSFRDTVLNTSPTEAWWRANMDLPAYYTFHAINRLIGNVDVRGGFNHYFWHRSTDNRWVIIPWDLDMMFIAKSHWTTDINGTSHPGVAHHHKALLEQPLLALEYRNRAREILDLLGSDPAPAGGQLGQLVDEFAQLVNPAGQPLTIADADAALWNLHPRTQGGDGNHSGQTNHRGNFWWTPFTDSRFGGDWVRWLRSPAFTGVATHEDSMAYLRDYATNAWPGGGWTVNNGDQRGYGYQYLLAEAADPAIPSRPVISPAGAAGFPTNDLTFSSSPFAGPQGAATFAAVEWRLARIAAPGLPGFTAGDRRRYEIEALHQSGELTTTTNYRFPGSSVKPGHIYRARVRHKDTSGRWSHWSEPLQFTATAPTAPEGLADKLVVSEINYHPLPPSTPAESAAAGTDKNQFEFIELRNTGHATLDLTDVGFTEGVIFTFPPATTIAPGACILAVKNRAAFEARYGTGLPIAAEWGEPNLDNAGERLVLAYAGATTLRDFTYDDAPPWPTTPDGAGPTLVLVKPSSNPNHNLAASWRAGTTDGGTPGAPDGTATVSLSGLDHTYDGAAKQAAAATNPAGLATTITYDSSPYPPTAAGVYQVEAVVADTLYEGASTATLTIAPASQSIAFDPPASRPLDGPPLDLSAAATSSLPVAFAVLAGPAALAGNRLTFSNAGQVLVRASQPGDGNWLTAPPAERTIDVTNDYPNSHWRSQHFSAAELADPLVSGPAADPDHDGLANMLEYAFATDPRLPETAPPVVAGFVTSAGDDFLAVTFRRRHPDLGIGYFVEVSPDLAAWDHLPPAVVEHGLPVSNGDGTATVTLRSSLPVGALPAEFVRLRVELPPP